MKAVDRDMVERAFREFDAARAEAQKLLPDTRARDLVEELRARDEVELADELEKSHQALSASLVDHARVWAATWKRRRRTNDWVEFGDLLGASFIKVAEATWSWRAPTLS